MINDSFNKRKAQILVVEDDRTNIQIIGNILSREKYEVVVALDTKSAYDILDHRKPDLILLDIMMPGESGIEFCRKLKKSHRSKDIPVIYLTAKAEEEDIVTGFETGAVDYITKPFHKGELLARVRTHLELKWSREELYEKTIIDELTGLYNRRHIRGELEHELHRAYRYNQLFALAILDIDNFKQINDTLGHNVGDKALKMFANICMENIRKTDQIGRVGGEEFFLILPETSGKEGEVVAERIREAVEKETTVNDMGIPPFTVSIGMATKKLTDDDIQSIDSITNLADKALYQAKSEGKNKVCVINK